VAKDLPILRGTAFDNVTLLHLGTYMSGGLPLQVPNEIKNDEQLMDYFRNWKPTYPPGTYRSYSNPSIGLLGLITAKTMKADFAALMEGTLFPALGLKKTYINVPSAEMDHYAQGYTDKDEPIRMTPGALWEQAYGVRTTAGDLVRFVAANINTVNVDPKWQRAIADTHTGYYRIGAMTQDLVWEQYSYPVESKDLVWGNSPEVSYKANAAQKIDPPSPPRKDVLINKTGSTNGFGTYVAFVPAKKAGVVLLANKPYPYGARVTLVLEIFNRLVTPAPTR
jgi:beta-lactamase class C